MKKLICLCLGLILCGCTGVQTAQNDEVKKVNVNVIEVSASSVDEIEEMAIKDVEDTKEKLESERDALGEKITDYNLYTKNVDKVKTYYEGALKQTELLSIRLREYAYKYAELIMNEDASYKVKYKDLSGIYEYIYEDAGKAMYDIYDKTLKDMYDMYYDGIIKDAYDEIDYDEWYDVHSDAYDDWYDARSDVYDIWYDTRSDIYDFQYDLRSEVYDQDDERAQKKMDKFKKSILRMKEDVNDQRESIIFSNFFKNELASLNIVVYSKQACVGECVTVRITTAQDKIQEERLMSKKKVTKVCKLQFQAGGAKPGPALASAGINMPQFCTAFNDATKDRKGDIVPVVITAYEDKSFDFVLKTTPAANLLKKAANVQKASGDQKVVAGTITVDQLKEIAEYKMPDLNANDVEAAMRIVAGTARNMGIKVEGFEQEEHQ